MPVWGITVEIDTPEKSIVNRREDYIMLPIYGRYYIASVEKKKIF